MVLQSRPPEYGPGRFHPKAASGHGCITVLLLGSVEIGGITSPTQFSRALHMPTAEQPVLSADSDFWHREHGVSPNEIAALDGAISSKTSFSGASLKAI